MDFSYSENPGVLVVVSEAMMELEM